MTGAIEDTLKHALFLARHLNKCDLQCVTVAILLELEIPTKRIGFDYLKNAILVFCTDPAQMITKGIYPAVGNLYNPPVGSLQVEQAIRSAIKDAWNNRNEEVWLYYFPSGRDGKVKKPSNAEFISRIARFLELWQGCCKEADYENK